MIQLPDVAERQFPNRNVHLRHCIHSEPIQEFWPAASSPGLTGAQRCIIPVLDLCADVASVAFVSKMPLFRTKTVFVLQI
jgi:hypothetical protein